MNKKLTKLIAGSAATLTLALGGFAMVDSSTTQDARIIPCNIDDPNDCRRG